MNPGSMINVALVIGIPGIVSILGWVFLKPTQEEMRVSNLRKSLRLSLRVQISYSIASIIPIKQKNISIQNYNTLCNEEINNYLGSDKEILNDYYDSEILSKRYISYLRGFKYLVYLSPLFGIILFAIPYIFAFYNLSLVYFIICGCLLAFIIILFAVIMEKRKDKFHDLCLKYEIVSENKN